jgi:WS/DGAT/MGAT family acyltransferase
MPLLDLTFLLLERPESPSNVGALMLFDPPGGSRASVAAARIARAYRAAQPTPPFDSLPDLSIRALPRWRRAERIDLRRHVLRETLEPPGDVHELCRHVARLHEPMLDRGRPLFELHVIDGLASGQVALYLKSHHAYWDGRYALGRVFGDMARRPGPVAVPFFAGGAAATPVGAAADRLAQDLSGGLKSLLAQVSAVGELLTRLSARTRTPAGAGHRTGNRPFAVPHTRFNDPVGAERTVACFRLPLDEMRRIGRAAGGTLNDVALAVVDAGVERVLAARGERPREPLVAMCPVSVRPPGDLEPTTKAASLFVPLAQPRAGSLDRLRQIVANTRAAKDEFEALSREAALDYALLAFGLWFVSNKLGFGAVTRPVINFAVSNVGEVGGERYVGDCRLAAAYPVSMLADPTGLNVTLLSVDGHMDFGIVANAAALKDAFELAHACEAAFLQLSRAARRGAAVRPAPARRKARPKRAPASAP